MLSPLLGINDKLKDLPDLKWALVGSMASVIQGCDIVPGDIDIWVAREADVEQVVNCFREQLPEDAIITTIEENWVSSLTQPTVTFQIDRSDWTLGRVYINSVKIDIAYAVIREMESYIPGMGLWENGPDIGDLIKFISVNESVIPVVPLEVQLQTNYLRGIESRIATIIDKFRTDGYDDALLRYCLEQDNYKRFLDKVSKGNELIT